MTSHLLRLWVIGSYEMPRYDWLQHCNFLAGIEILPIALQTACKPCGFAAGRPAIVAGPVLRVAIGESCSVCRALTQNRKKQWRQQFSTPPLSLLLPLSFLHLLSINKGKQMQDSTSATCNTHMMLCRVELSNPVCQSVYELHLNVWLQ